MRVCPGSQHLRSAPPYLLRTSVLAPSASHSSEVNDAMCSVWAGVISLFDPTRAVKLVD